MKKILIILTLSLFGGNLLQAKTISLNDFIQAYYKNSESLKISFQKYLSAQGQSKSTKGVDDFKVKMNAGYTYQKDPSGSVLTIDKATAISGGFGLEKVISATGTRIDLSHQLVAGSSTLGTNPYPSVAEWTAMNGKSMDLYTPSLTLSIIQPLLQNAFGLLDRYPMERARLQKKIQNIYYKEAQEQTILRATQLYFNWLSVSERIKILKEILEDSQVILQQTRKKIRAGVAERSDLEAARSTVILYQSEIFKAEQDYRRVSEEIKKYMSISQYDQPDISILKNSHQFSEKSLKSNIRPMQILGFTESQLRLDVKAAKNQLLPSLNLIANYTHSGSHKNFGDSYSEMKTSEFFGGLQLSFPLGNNSAQGKLESSNANLKGLLFEKQKTVKSLRQQFATLNYQFARQKKILQNKNEYVKSLLAKSRSEKKQYRQGRLSLQEVLRTSIELANARLQRNFERIAYHQLYYSLMELVDKLEGVFQVKS